MRLTDLRFNYEISSKKFDSLCYDFSIPLSRDADKNSVGNEIKHTSESLQDLLDEEFKGEDLVKTPTGSLSANFTNFGYDYRGKRTVKSWFKVVSLLSSFRASINCRIYAPEGKVQSVEVDISHHDSNDDLLRLYDKVLGIGGIELSSSAKYASSRIALLRQGPKLGEALKLLN